MCGAGSSRWVNEAVGREIVGEQGEGRERDRGGELRVHGRRGVAG